MFENLLVNSGLSPTDCILLFLCIFIVLFLVFVKPLIKERNTTYEKEKHFDDLRKKSISFIFNFNSIDKVLLFNNKVISVNEWKLIILDRFNDCENIIYNQKENSFYTIKEIVETSDYIFIDRNLIKQIIKQG